MQRPQVPPLTVRDVGEFGLIQRIAGLLRSRAGGEKATVGLGDDAAIWRPTVGTETIITADTMVQDVHFRLETITWRDLGWKAMAMNVSDVAAMGGRPRFAVVTIGLPPTTTVDAVRDLYDGIQEFCDHFSVQVIGGDTVSSPLFLVSVTVTGETLPTDSKSSQPDGPPALLRSSARPGDRILITGYLGGAAAGLELLEARTELHSLEEESLVRAHVHPFPRVEEGMFLVKHGVRAGADNSDGLIRQVLLFREASGVGAVLDSRSLPIDPSVRAVFPTRATELALYGGEAYELIVTAPQDILETLKPAWDSTFTVPFTDIGYMREGSGLIVLDSEGRETIIDSGGFDHFRTTEPSA